MDWSACPRLKRQFDVSVLGKEETEGLTRR
jgi:hypothetical protein